MTEPDFAIFLIRAEQAMARIYPKMCDGKIAEGLVEATEVVKHLQDLQAWVLKRAK